MRSVKNRMWREDKDGKGRILASTHLNLQVEAEFRRGSHRSQRRGRGIRKRIGRPAEVGGLSGFPEKVMG